jgi:predicted SAM-dependent methyltransferase
LNADVTDSECDVDLTSRLPWPDATFSAIVSQHVIEHVEFEELIGLLAEVRRILRADGEVWLSCPDMEKICLGYVKDRAASLAADQRARYPTLAPSLGIPQQQAVNGFFHQGGEHKNLYDFELLAWVVDRAGFRACERVEENTLLARFPEFPRRADDAVTLYVVARP